MSHPTETTHPTGSAGPTVAGRTAGAGHRDAPATADEGRAPVAADTARDRIVQRCFGLRPPRLVGAELEWCTRTATGSRPAAAHLVEALGAHAPRSIAPGSPHTPLPAGGAVTVEPGGQVEISSLPLADVDGLCAALAADAAALRTLLGARGIEMLPGAVDHVREPSRILTVPRYAAMQERFDRRGPRGAQMMCNTAAIHVSVDCGAHREDLALRWRMLNAVGPALVAAFADGGSTAGAEDGHGGSAPVGPMGVGTHAHLADTRPVPYRARRRGARGVRRPRRLLHPVGAGSAAAVRPAWERRLVRPR
ncbi:glutamate-cysteine ligase family protein [Tomitella gaofuii]|uniref:glutamate-cysteine ligase family protein n=1 Tax=Tomitella gaofuii TaxID=2760083 RepID=UPI001F254E7D|nr:glutamate-cysteine ligase family protein [Tomitella gaofuii]